MSPIKNEEEKLEPADFPILILNVETGHIHHCLTAYDAIVYLWGTHLPRYRVFVQMPYLPFNLKELEDKIHSAAQRVKEV